MGPVRSTPFAWLLERADALVDRWRTATATDTRSLAVVRVLFGLLMLFVGWPSYAPMAGLPSAFFNPPVFSIASLFSGFPYGWVLHGLDVIVLIALVTLTLGLFTRISTLVLLLALVVGNSFLYSFGKIDHDIMALALLFTMLFRDWGRHWSIDAWLKRSSSPATNEPTDLLLLGVFLSFGYFSAGFGKLITWVDFDPTTGGFLGWLYQTYHVQGKTQLLAGAAIAFRPLWLWELADYAAIAFEMVPFIALLRARWWLLWLASAAMFHLFNLLFLNISFIIYVPVYAAFLPWSTLFPRSGAKRGIPLLAGALLTILVGAHLMAPGTQNSALLSLLDLTGTRTLLPYIHLTLYALLALLALRSIRAITEVRGPTDLKG